MVRTGDGQRARTGVVHQDEVGVQSVEEDQLLDLLLQGLCVLRVQSFLQTIVEGQVFQGLCFLLQRCTL